MTCKTCRWWVKTGDEHESSTRCCTRYPPVLLAEAEYQVNYHGVWPETPKCNMACGEYAASPDEEADDGK